MPISEIDRQLEICRLQLPSPDQSLVGALEDWLAARRYFSEGYTTWYLLKHAPRWIYERVIAWAKATRPVCMPCPTCNGNHVMPLPHHGQSPWLWMPCAKVANPECLRGKVLDPEALAVLFDELLERPELWADVHAFPPAAPFKPWVSVRFLDQRGTKRARPAMHPVFAALTLRDKDGP